MRMEMGMGEEWGEGREIGGKGGGRGDGETGDGRRETVETTWHLHRPTGNRRWTAGSIGSGNLFFSSVGVIVLFFVLLHLHLHFTLLSRLVYLFIIHCFLLLFMSMTILFSTFLAINHILFVHRRLN